MEKTPIIDIHNLYFSYGEADILRNVTVSIYKGEFIGVIGPNGGGKTTLLNLLMGFLKPRSGEISILNTSPKNARKSVAWVPQVLRYDKNFPISTIEVVLGGRLSKSSWFGGFHKADKEKALYSLKRVGMEDYYNAAFSTLSGGQAQRVLIARALASDPEILFLDEPIASVDPQAESAIYNILSQLKGKLTIIMVTHNLRAILEQVDRVVCVQQEISVLDPAAICEHFAFGLYHPLMNTKLKTERD